MSQFAYGALSPTYQNSSTAIENEIRGILGKYGLLRNNQRNESQPNFGTRLPFGALQPSTLALPLNSTEHSHEDFHLSASFNFNPRGLRMTSYPHETEKSPGFSESENIMSQMGRQLPLQIPTRFENLSFWPETIDERDENDENFDALEDCESQKESEPLRPLRVDVSSQKDPNFETVNNKSPSDSYEHNYEHFSSIDRSLKSQPKDEFKNDPGKVQSNKTVDVYCGLVDEIDQMMQDFDQGKNILSWPNETNSGYNKKRHLEQFFDQPDFKIPSQIKRNALKLPPTPRKSQNTATEKDNVEYQNLLVQTDLNIREIARLDNKIAELENRNSNLEATVEDLEKLERRLREENQRLAEGRGEENEREVEAIRSDFELKLESMKLNCDKEHKHRISELEHLVNNLGDENLSLREHLSRLAGELETVRESVKNDRAASERQLGEERAKKEESERERERLRGEVERIEKEREGERVAAAEREKQKEEEEERKKKASRVHFDATKEDGEHTETFENEGEVTRDSEGVDGWYSQIKGPRKYKGLPEKEQRSNTQFQPLPSAKNKSGINLASNQKPKVNELMPSLEQKQRLQEEPSNIADFDSDFHFPGDESTKTPCGSIDDELGHLNEGKTKEERLRKKHEKQLADLEEYYESELQQLQSQKDSPQMTQQILREKDEQIAMLTRNQEQLNLANARVHQLSMELAKYQSVASPHTPILQTPPPPVQMMVGGNSGMGGGVPTDLMKYSHLSLAELKQLHQDIQVKLQTLRNKLQHLPPGGHLTPQNKRERREWAEKVEELEPELKFITKLLRKLEKQR